MRSAPIECYTGDKLATTTEAIAASFPFYPDGVPDELKPGDKWVCCNEKKVPLVALVDDYKLASSTDPDTWRSYEQALAALGTGRYAGIGRVIEEHSDLVGVDIDGCRDPQTGGISPWAWEIIERLDSYTEVSPLQEGVKIWVKTPALKVAHIKPALEIYPRGRYFTVTGQVLAQEPTTVEERSEELSAIIAEQFPQTPKREKAPYNGPPIDILDYLEGVEVIAELPDGGGRKWAVVCPWVEEHSDGDVTGTYVGQFHVGAPWFCCYRAHCARRGWVQFRQVLNRWGRLRRRAAEETYYTKEV